MLNAHSIPYNQLIKITPQPTYQQLLDTPEWKDFRKQIIERDKKCVKCNVAIEADDGGYYYRKLTPEEIAEHDKEWENFPGTDLLGDGKFVIKGQKSVIVGVYLVIQVHHKYYVSGKLPWEYDREVLITVCRDCHVKIHSEEKIFIYTDDSLTAYRQVSNCSVCTGTGYRPEYDYYQNGICFHCDGRGYIDDIIPAP
jgi:hypothetical protein